MLFRLTRRAALVGSASAVVSPQRVRAAERRVRLAQNNTASSPSGLACKTFAASVAADPLLQNTLHIAVYHEGAMGDEVASVQGCLEGSIDMAMISGAAVSNFAPVIGVLDIPFLFKGTQAARSALDGEVGAELAEAARSHGVNVLAWGENGVRHITANRPIRGPADLSGLKLRVPQSDVEVTGFRALGADPRPIPAQKIYEALRNGEVEAQENAFSVIEDYRLFEVQKFLCLTGHIYSAFPMLASQDLLDDLSENQRIALKACAQKAAAASRQAVNSVALNAITRLRAFGMTVIEDVDTPAFFAAAKPNLAAMSQKFGAELITRLQQSGA
jgi:tripartite ATP-independent transporter DctP family solute receptor